MPAYNANRRVPSPASCVWIASSRRTVPRRRHGDDTAPREPRNRILVWMCVLIAVNQLGFGAVVPVIALYARSFGVPQSAIGLAIAVYGLARFLVAMPAGQLGDRLGRRAALAVGRARHRGGQSALRVRADLRRLRRRALRGRRGRGARGHTGPDRARRHHHAGAARAHHGDLPGRVPLRRRHRAPAGRAARRALRARRAVRRPTRRRALVASALGVARVPETRGLRASGAAPRPRRAALRRAGPPPHRAAGFVLVSRVGFVNAVARTGALFNVIPLLARDRLALTADRIGLGLALASVVGLALVYPSGVLVDRYGRKDGHRARDGHGGRLARRSSSLAPSYAWFLVGCVAWSVAVGRERRRARGLCRRRRARGHERGGDQRLPHAVGPRLRPRAPSRSALAADLFGADVTLGVTALLLVAVALLFAASPRRRTAPAASSRRASRQRPRRNGYTSWRRYPSGTGSPAMP